MQQKHSTAAIILAAGSSSRMGGGRHKLLLPLEGRPVLAHVIDATLASQAHPVVIVLGHQAEHVRTQLTAYTASPEIIIVENPDYLQGMSTSMRVGIQEIISYGYRKNEQCANIDSVLILLGDQPLITQQGIDALITAWRTSGKRIMAPLYAGKRGNPLIFDASLFSELIAVTGDEGGRSVVERHKQELATIELGDVIANYDVDTWEAYQQVVEVWQNKATQKTTETE
ncbi:MAG: nucleotidyltransferase family protein [Ktedonobacteraceae bacterium]